MQPNSPAALLHDRLKSWQTTPAGVTVLTHRAIDGDWITPHVDAIAWASQVDAYMTLTGWGDTERLGLMDVIMRAIFSTCEQMDAPPLNDREHISNEWLLVLYAVAVDWREPSVRREHSTDVLDAIDGLHVFIAESVHLDDDARRYLLDLVAALDKALHTITVLGASEVRRLATELAGALIVYFTDAPTDEAQRAGSFFSKLVKGVKQFVGVAAGHIVEGGTAAFISGVLPPGQ